MSGEIKEADVERAKSWCRKARELLGMGYVGDSRQMYLYNEAISSNLKELNRLGFNDKYQALGREYQRISELAKKAEQSNDDPATRALIAEMGVLESEIQVAISMRRTDQLKNEKTLFERRKPLVEAELEQLEQIADADTYRRLALRFGDIVTSTKSPGDYAIANPNLKQLDEEVRKSIQSFKEDSKRWEGEQSRRDATQQALEKLDESSPWHHTIDKLFKASIKCAESHHLYSLAYQLLERAEAAFEQQKSEYSEIEKKIIAFRNEEPTLLQLETDVEERLQRLLNKFTEEQRNRGTRVADKDFAAMGGMGTRFVRAKSIIDEYRGLSTESSYEGWGGYPQRVDESVIELNGINDELKRIGSDPTAIHNLAIDLIKIQRDLAADESRLKAWVKLSGEVQAELNHLASSVGATNVAYTNELARFNEFRSTWNSAHTFDKSKLRKLISDIQKRLEAEVRARQALQEQRLELRDKWNELLEQSDVFPEAYYSGLSDEYDACNIYLDSNNTAIVELGLQKRQALLDRFKAAIANPESTKQGSQLLVDIKTLVAESDLITFRPTDHGLHKFELDQYEESGIVHTEDPATLLPRLTALKTAVESSLQKAREKKRIVAAVDSSLDDLAPLLSQLDQRLDAFCLRGGKQLPPAYQVTFRAASQMHARYARMLEDPDKAREHQAKLADLKIEVLRLLGSSDELNRYFDDTETKRISSETERAAASERERLTYLRELAEFEQGLLKEVQESHGQMGIWNLFYDDQLKNVKAHLGQMRQRAEKGEFSAARRILTQAIAAARDLKVRTADSAISRSLSGLDKDWENRVIEMNSALNTLGSEIRDIAGEYSSGDATSLSQKAQLIVSLFDDVDAAEFTPYLDKILSKERTDQKQFAEKALEVTRRRLRLVESDPLLQKLVDNPFNVVVRTIGLRKVLRQLELNLVTVR